MKKILFIANFIDESPRSIQSQQRMWVKGLIRNGCDVQRFSYSNMMMQLSPLSSKRVARTFGKKKTDDVLVQQAENYQPDIVFFHAMKNLDYKTVRKLKSRLPNAFFAARDEDPFPEKNPARVAIAKECDLIVNTSAGKFLQVYKDAGVKTCAFLPNMSDSDIQFRYPEENKYLADIMFSGKPEHTKLERYDERYELVNKISKMSGVRVYGGLGNPQIQGIEYFKAISSAKIGLSINIANDVELYHSDRMINYVACGTFTIAKRVPNTELLFENKKHVVYFNEADEFFELSNYYLKKQDEREKIAIEGMKHTYEEFNCEKIVRKFLDIVETGDYNAKWKIKI